jgi:hypothetical protein
MARRCSKVLKAWHEIQLPSAASLGLNPRYGESVSIVNLEFVIVERRVAYWQHT